MTAYDTSDLEGVRVGFGNVKTHVDALRCRWDLSSSDTSSTTSSTSFAVLYTRTITGIVASDVLDVSFDGAFSINSTTERVELYLNIGGNLSYSTWLLCPTASTTGQTNQISMHHIVSGLSGSVTINAHWKKTSGAAVAYCSRKTLITRVFKDGGAL